MNVYLFSPLKVTYAADIQIKNISLDLLPALLEAILNPVPPEDKTTDYLDETLGALPSSLDSLDALQTYAAYYALESHRQLINNNSKHDKVNLNTSIDPCARLSLVGNDATSAVFRVQQIFSKSAKISPQVSINRTKNAQVYFLLNDHKAKNSSDNRRYFGNFLMKNNEDLLPNYREILETLAMHAKHSHEQVEKYAAKKGN